jgi:limonene-1,2-epoxide hydrolase
MSLAPIGIVTYSRIDHLTQTVESLKANILAKESELYIFLDAPRLGDEEKVDIVRKYIHTIDGFKKVYIIEREKNDLYANYKLGIKQLLDEHGRCIFMEDDNVVSSDFLQYMNDGLEFYKDDKSIFAINGFNVPVSVDKYPKEYKNDYYLSSYFCAAGFGTWNDRDFLNIVNYNDGYKELISNNELYKKIKRKVPHLINELKRIQEGTLDAGDYKITFYMIKNDMYVIKPIESKVNNIGHDGSGVHCEATDKFNNQITSNKNIQFNTDVIYMENIDQVWRDFFDKKPPIFERIKRKIKKVI